ncbi:peptidylprolyl isomerase [Parvularcula sp. IMCC14364]|uniref:peptidylprolyl isomerase n=1 Tax=Parvularcula sp. IMCC14364 TaxID=3067902 RepID=UPI0027417187|nr:peptidylprolyl isomerase [Parvularcula sp. IMCC14364]
MPLKILRQLPEATWYAVGALIALAVALMTALGIAPATGQRGAVAIVNEDIILRTEYERALTAMQAGLARPLTAEDKARALDILINEELIVQRALALDMARTDRQTRKTLIQAVIRSSLALDGPIDPTQDALRKLYEDEQGLFSSPDFVTVRIAGTTSPESLAQFRALMQAGNRFEDAVSAAGLEDFSPPPDLPLGKLSDYTGRAGLEAVSTMEAGEIAGPFTYAGRNIYIWLQARTGGTALPFDMVSSQVEAEWRRRQEEQAFTDYINRLRRQAHIKTLIDPAETTDATP